MKKIYIYLLLCFPFLATAQLESSNLPIVVITTTTSIVDEPKIEADMGIIDNGAGQINYITDPFNGYEGKIGIELRGSSSQSIYPKKQYAVETRDSLGANNNVSLLGLPKENDWILHAPYGDKTLLRNALTYKLAGQMMDYAPRYKFCEVLINGDYKGVYLLMEKIKRDKNRVNVTKSEENDITGGYILKIDKFTGSGNDGFVSDYPPLPGKPAEVNYLYHYPKADDITTAQKEYIQNFIGQFEAVMASNDYADPEEGYSKYIDYSTFIDFMLINELSKNVDGYRISTFFYKDRDSVDPRLKMGPVWDFNLGYGNADYCTGPEPQGWAYNFAKICPDDYWLPPVWWKRLRLDSTFRFETKARWESLRTNILSTENIMACIDSMVAETEMARNRNFNRWPIQSEYVWPNAFVGGNYINDLNYMKDWLEDRLAWMDGQFDDYDRVQYNPADYFDPRVYPNPFVDEINFDYYIYNYEEVSISIYNAQGQLVINLQDKEHPNGEGRLTWENQNLARGVYFYTIEVNGEKIKTGTIMCNK